jgi:drug/metabolite transporter (DMT)-like permease
MRRRVVSSQPVERKSSLNAGYAGVLFAAASWGSWTVFLGLAQREHPVAAPLCSFVVMTTIALLLAPLALRATGRRAEPRSLREWWLLAAFGVSDALNCGLYFGALQETSVAVAVLTHYLAPLLVALAAPVVLGERRHPLTLVSVPLGLFGLTLLLAPWAGADAFGQLGRGALLGLGSAFFYAASMLFSKRLARSFDASEMIVYHTPTALLSLGWLMPEGGWSLSPYALTWLLAGSLGPGALAGVVFMRSLAVVPAAQASVLTLVEPFSALAFAALVWGEPLDASRLTGGAAILAAGYLVMARPPHLKGPLSPAPNS